MLSSAPAASWSRSVHFSCRYLVVTCNYPAREQGVTKLVNVAEARRRCPSIVLVK